MKKHSNRIALGLAALGMLSVLASCGESTAAVSDLKFDFVTGEFTFSGVKDASEYRVRVFEVIEGTRDELPINETNPLRGGKDSYSGTLALWSLTPGNTYQAYVLATFDKSTTEGNTVEGMYKCQLGTITAGVDATYTDTAINVVFGSDAMNDYDTGCNYDVTLYKGTEKVQSLTLANADIVYTAGQSSQAGTYDAKLSFDITAAADDYSVTVQELATADSYLDGAVSEKFAVTKASDAPVDAGGEDAGGGSSF